LSRRIFGTINFFAFYSHICHPDLEYFRPTHMALKIRTLKRRPSSSKQTNKVQSTAHSSHHWQAKIDEVGGPAAHSLGLPFANANVHSISAQE
jgi:hypothetical protein